MRECSREMDSCVDQSSQANNASGRVQGIVVLISDMSSQIASAAERQQATSADIATNLNRISDISDLNYQGTERVAGDQPAARLPAEQQGGAGPALPPPVPDGHDPTRQGPHWRGLHCSGEDLDQA